MPPGPLPPLSSSLCIGIDAAARPSDARVGARAGVRLLGVARRLARRLCTLGLLGDVLHSVSALDADDVLVEARPSGGARVADPVCSRLLIREACGAVEVGLLVAVATLVLLVIVRFFGAIDCHFLPWVAADKPSKSGLSPVTRRRHEVI